MFILANNVDIENYNYTDILPISLGCTITDSKDLIHTSGTEAIIPITGSSIQ